MSERPDRLQLRHEPSARDVRFDVMHRALELIRDAEDDTPLLSVQLIAYVAVGPRMVLVQKSKDES